MELTLEQVLGGKSTKIKNKEYFPTAAYVEPFIERLSKYTNNFVCKAVLPNQITMTKDGDINLEDQTWNRVWIQAILPDNYPIPNHNTGIRNHTRRYFESSRTSIWNYTKILYKKIIKLYN